jgi:hypothetical protein
MRFISVEEYLMGRTKMEDLPDDVIRNISTLIPKVNDLLELFGEYRKVTSGFRTPEINASIPNAAKRSKHMIGAAVDLDDADGKLDAWCMSHQEILKKLGLHLEHPSATKGWTHLQCISPKSGNIVFYP